MRRRAFVLPTLLLVTVALLTLATALLTSGTSGLRLATHDQHTDQALYAAEAGLARVSAQLAAGSTDEYFEGTVGDTGCHYVVRVYPNTSEVEYQVPNGGPVIPAHTAYVLAEGFSDNEVRRTSGALFQIGLFAFKVGALGINGVNIENALMDSFNGSKGDYDPTDLETDLPLLASNSSTGPTFAFENAQVSGDIFLGPNGNASTQVTSTNSTLGNIKPMASKIELEDIVVPDLSKDDDDPVYVPALGALTLQTVDLDNKYTFSDGQGMDFVVDPAAYNPSNPTGHITPGPGVSIIYDNYNDELTIKGPKGPGHFTLVQKGSIQSIYIDTTSASGSMDTGLVDTPDLNAIIFGSAPPAPPSGEVINPAVLKPGQYTTVKVEDGFPSSLSKDGEYVIENLIVDDGSSLGLPNDAKATIYVTKTLSVSGRDAILNATRRAPNLKVYYVGNQPVRLSGGSESYFTLVAPEAKIELDTATPGTPTQFFGALVGLNVAIKNAQFHFDTSTTGIGTGTMGTSMVLLHHHRL